MEYTKSEILDSFNYTMGLSKVEKHLAEFENQTLSEIEIEKIATIRKKNLKLKSKDRTYNRCLIQSIISGLIFILCYFTSTFPILQFISPIIFISSFAGIITNNLSIQERTYLKR